MSGGEADGKNKFITCVCVGVFAGALTRGSRYEVLEEDPVKRQVKVRGDNQRHRWYPAYCFDLEGNPAPTLVSWQFDTSVEDEKNDNVDVSFTLSDGTCRWSLFITPDNLNRLLSQPYSTPGLWASHLVVVKLLSPTVVEAMLRHLDENGDLIPASLPINDEEDREFQ